MASIRVHNPLAPRLRRTRMILARDIESTLKAVGDELVNEIDRNLSGRVLHFRTGRLWASWRDPQVVRWPKSWTLTLGSDVPYARIHEFGGWTGAGHRTHIPQRPYLRRAVLKLMPRIQKRLQNAVWDILRWT